MGRRLERFFVLHRERALKWVVTSHIMNKLPSTQPPQGGRFPGRSPLATQASSRNTNHARSPTYSNHHPWEQSGDTESANFKCGIPNLEGFASGQPPARETNRQGGHCHQKCNQIREYKRLRYHCTQPIVVLRHASNGNQQAWAFTRM